MSEKVLTNAATYGQDTLKDDHFQHNIYSFSNEHFYESVFETLALGDLGFPCLGQSWGN